ncbi:Protein NUCLEAR FUSION DEFECTIVE 4 [Hibiscus syriacus]|uniref:Protein NUCLEAR FUSION DEFECTIVE 4 n=1 Tax=Hibiscus syriacus TaxID=106335 RepID=A0A6A2WZV8_HIBSY|nr:Protein NUCLEAR FUSION DEFECTIVE 4 [Hibiscus syriacus]
MAVQSRKWMILVATIWIQAFTGTNFDFSSYSSTFKSVLGISQVQLNYLSVASDMGKAFGWCSGVFLMYFPLWVVMFMAAFFGFFGYALQWLVIKQFISMPYFLVFLLCLVAGCSITWFNTVCFVLCIRNFPNNRALALSLTISFNGVSAALYTLIANAINPEDDTLYPFLNAVVPLLASCIALIPVIHQPPLQLLSANTIKTGVFVLIPSLDDPNELELHKELIEKDQNNSLNIEPFSATNKEGFFDKVLEKGRLKMLGEEHSARLLVCQSDFWLYYVAYFCGGTIGLVYSNNLGQIAQSLGYDSNISTVVTLYSSFSFFGRLLSAAPDFLHGKVNFARTGWLAVALVPTPVAFFLLAVSGSEAALLTSTALIGLSSGFVFSAAVSITSELFGPNSASINHNILITNIPIGSLLYGLLAALVYDSKVRSPINENVLQEAMVCMGKDCYMHTFISWGCISLLGLISSFLLFLRTGPAYDYYETNLSRSEDL